MSWRDWGNPPITSTTQAVTSNPSTSALVAELDSTNLASTGWRTARTHLVSWVVGASTLGAFRLEHALSTGLGSTAIRSATVVYTANNQSAEYVLTYRLEPNDRLRVRMESTFTGNAFATITAEALT